MSPGEEQHTPPDSTISDSENTTLADGKPKPSIGKQHRSYHLLFYNDSIWRHTVVVVCVCVCEWVSESFCETFLCDRWKLRTEMCKVSITHCYLEMKNGEFWIRGFIVKLWHDLLILTVVVSNQEFNEELVNYLSPWKVHLYHKINGDPSESLSLKAALAWGLCLHAHCITKSSVYIAYSYTVLLE